MKHLIVWAFHDALSFVWNGRRYVPDWEAIGAISTAAAAIIALAAVWYSIIAIERQLRHQSDLEAKKLEEGLLLRLMDVVQSPVDAARDTVTDIVLWRHKEDAMEHPEAVMEFAQRASEAYRAFATASATTLAVLRRSRRRRFRRGTTDEALTQYEDLVRRTLDSNAALLKYIGGDWTQLDLVEFEKKVGADAFSASDLLRRVTAELLARMYSDGREWVPFRFAQKATERTGAIGFDFVDDDMGR